MKTTEHLIQACGGTAKIASTIGIQQGSVAAWRRIGFPIKHAQMIHRHFRISYQIMVAASNPDSEFVAEGDLSLAGPSKEAA